MGGYGYQIYGAIDPGIGESVPARRNFWDKIFGRQRFTALKEIDLGKTRLIDLPADRFSPVKEDFFNYLKRIMDPPWKATTEVLKYLELDVTNLHFRGEKKIG